MSQTDILKRNIDNLYTQIKDAQGANRKRLFIAYVKEIVAMGNSNTWKLETCGYEIMRCIWFDDLTQDKELESIFDIACELEKNQEISYAQPIVSWNADTADKIKKEEWNRLLNVLQKFRI